MPQPRRESSRQASAAEAASQSIGDPSAHVPRIVTGPDPDRFYCPYPGCNRSFAELWRLKVHYRAPPDVRGSGKERGHGTELKFCPKCSKELKPGKHHVGCSAGKSAPRQAAKRQRQMSTTTETDWQTTTTTTSGSIDEENSDSWEETLRRQVSRVHRHLTDEETTATFEQRKVPTGQRNHAEDIACRVRNLQQALTAGDPNPNAELLFTRNTMADYGLILRHHHKGEGREAATTLNSHLDPPPPPSNPLLDDPLMLQGRHSPAPSLLRILEGEKSAGEGLGAGDGMGGDAISLLRAPSPPPLPTEWDFTSGPQGLLFDFDQFDVTKRRDNPGTEPMMTVTSSMNPAEMVNPSDDYVWQIMFASDEDVVPKRVTAHLHHPSDPGIAGQIPRDLIATFDQPDPFLDAIPWPAGYEGKVEMKTDEPGAMTSMQPPAPRQPSGKSPMPVLPAQPPTDVLEHAEGEQTVTVTYVVKEGPSGKPQYAVKSVETGGKVGGDGGSNGVGTNGSKDGEGNGTAGNAS